MDLDSSLHVTDVHATDIIALNLGIVMDARDTPAKTSAAANPHTISEVDDLNTTQINVTAQTIATVPEQAPPFQLLKLPTEIRLLIFEEFLQMARPILFKNSIYVVDRHLARWVHRPAPFSIVRHSPRSTAWYHATGDMITIQQKNIFGIFRVSKTINAVCIIPATRTSARKSSKKRYTQAAFPIPTYARLFQY